MNKPDSTLLPSGRGGDLVRALLGVPLLYKLLAANIAIVLAGAVAGTAFTADLVRADPTFSTPTIIGVFALVGVGVSALANVLVLQLALSPLKQLERAAGRVQRGDPAARAAPSSLADADLRQLTETFNATLTSLTYYRQRLRDVAAAALRAAEVERRRMALELHDDTAPTLVALLARLGAARATHDSAERDAYLEEVRHGLAQAIDGIRRIAQDVLPAALDERGVAAAVREHARAVSEATGLRVDVDADPIDGLFAPEADLALYRIVQEALSNVVRHAGARTVRIHIERRVDAIVAVINDDGNGFSVSEELQRTDRGLGLFGMQERAAYLGGRVDIESRPGRGTSVLVKIPAKVRDDGD